MKKTDQENEAFRKYREQMHGSEEYDEPQNTPGHSLRVVFSIFMVIVYIGMGVLLMLSTNFFGFPDSLEWMRIAMGVLLVIYGLWRAFRAYKGLDTRF